MEKKIFLIILASIFTSIFLTGCVEKTKPKPRIIYLSPQINVSYIGPKSVYPRYPFDLGIRITTNFDNPLNICKIDLRGSFLYIGGELEKEFPGCSLVITKRGQESIVFPELRPLQISSGMNLKLYPEICFKYSQKRSITIYLTPDEEIYQTYEKPEISPPGSHPLLIEINASPAYLLEFKEKGYYFKNLTVTVNILKATPAFSYPVIDCENTTLPVISNISVRLYYPSNINASIVGELFSFIPPREEAPKEEKPPTPPPPPEIPPIRREGPSPYAPANPTKKDFLKEISLEFAEPQGFFIEKKYFYAPGAELGRVYRRFDTGAGRLKRPIVIPIRVKVPENVTTTYLTIEIEISYYYVYSFSNIPFLFSVK